MFKHRLSKFGKASLYVVCMLLAGGSFVSCEDEYFYDDREPEWLGASIYDFLNEGSSGHTYKNFVELIDSLGERETLAHTGSKTLFIADDVAFQHFFKSNPWNVKSVAEMSKAQMKILLYSAMLDNAMLLDMLSSDGPDVSNEGKRLRRETSVSDIDTIELTDKRPLYNKFWDARYGTGSKKIRLAKDGSKPMMVHFLPDYLKNNDIKPSDMNVLFKKSDGTQTKTYTEGEAFVFGNKLVTSDIPMDGFSDDNMTIVCKNGYLYRLDSVLLPPSNMAEELRRREDTKVFSYMLDRFCIPEYNARLSQDFNAYYGTNDSIFCLRYIDGAGSNFNDEVKLKSWYRLLDEVDAAPAADELLKFDPGRNDINDGTSGAGADMAAMFVPKDDVIFDYFVNGPGLFLLQNFAPHVEVVAGDGYESLIRALNCVPENNVAEFVNNLMHESFAGSVPSKFTKVVNDAKDEMGLEPEHVDECVIANNGVIYLMNTVFGPQSFEAVSAPLLFFANMSIMNQVNIALKYDYYLLAMKSVYSFIVPDDTAFVYYDPASKVLEKTDPTAYVYHYNSENPKNNTTSKQFWYEEYKYNKGTYELEGTPITTGVAKLESGDHRTRMTDLMEYLIVVHDEGDGIILPDGTPNNKKYHQTKGYGTIKVDTSNPDRIKFWGGEQLENGADIVAASTYAQKNGYTFCTVPEEGFSGVPTPPTRSVHSYVVDEAQDESHPFHEFGNLCVPAGVGEFEAVMLQLFPEEASNVTSRKKLYSDSTKLYSIFYTKKNCVVSSNGVENDDYTADKKTNEINNLVSFFNTYHYTVYVPSNEAVKEQIDSGLPQWEDILETAKVAPKKAAAQMRLLNSFLRYHFQDNSVYVDAVPFSMPLPGGGSKDKANFSTAVVNPKTSRFYETTVTTVDGTLQITDQLDRTAKVNKSSGAEHETWNIMARDIEYETKTVQGTKTPNTIKTSSFSVIHSIDNVLLHEGLFGFDGRYCRYANDGELVDKMDIKHGDKTVTHRVANCGKAQIADANGAMKSVRLAYLMRELSEGEEGYDSKYTREAYVLDENGQKILITNEGFLVKASTDDDVTTYEYAVDENNVRLRIDESGNICKENESAK